MTLSDSKIYYGTGPGIMNFLVYRTQPNESQTLPRKKKKKETNKTDITGVKCQTDLLILQKANCSTAKRNAE